MGDQRTPAPPPDPQLEALKHLVTAHLAIRQARSIIGGLNAGGDREALTRAYGQLGDAGALTSQSMDLVQRDLSRVTIDQLNLAEALKVTT